MPELPEVETIARQLSDLLCGQLVSDLRVVDRERLPLERPGQVRGYRVARVFRFGKKITIALSRSQSTLYVLFHLRMTGRLLWESRQRRARPHLRATLCCADGLLRFYDVRRFGTLELGDSLDPFRPAGLDPLSDALTPAALAEQLDSSRQSLKSWLLRQDRLVGLGNTYASEILFHARLHPDRTGRSLSNAEVGRLHEAIGDVLNSAISHCGTTFSDFQDAHGLTGSFQQFLAVYGRDGERCRRCSSIVQRAVHQQRSTFFCPRCQPAPDPPKCRRQKGIPIQRRRRIKK